MVGSPQLARLCSIDAFFLWVLQIAILGTLPSLPSSAPAVSSKKQRVHLQLQSQNCVRGCVCVCVCGCNPTHTGRVGLVHGISHREGPKGRCMVWGHCGGYPAPPPPVGYHRLEGPGLAHVPRTLLFPIKPYWVTGKDCSRPRTLFFRNPHPIPLRAGIPQRIPERQGTAQMVV